MRNLLIIFLTIGAIFSCSDKNKKAKNDKAEMTVEIQGPKKPHVFDGAQKLFLAQKLESPVGRVWDYIISGDVETKFADAGTLLPKATSIFEYGSKGQYRPLVIMRLPQDFEGNLPKIIQQQLETEGLLGKNKVDIFFNAQVGEWPNKKRELAQAGDDSDFIDLVPHGWADPEIPRNFDNYRVNRDFLVGVFDSDYNIAHEVKMGELKPFSVITHHGKISPKNRRIKIDPTKSQAFYSVVIGEIHPSKEKRANVTLHWVLNHIESRALYNDILKAVVFSADHQKKLYMTYTQKDFDSQDFEAEDKKLRAQGFDPETFGTELLDSTVGEFFTRINQDPIFKNSSLLNKLDALVSYSNTKK